MSSLERLEQLRREVAELEKSAAAEIAAKKEEALQRITAQMIADQITLEDVTQHLRRLSAKYSDGVHTWSGKGKKPDWLKRAVAGGAKIESLLVQPLAKGGLALAA